MKITPRVLSQATRATPCIKCGVATGLQCESLDGSRRPVKTHKERVKEARALLEASVKK